MSPAADSQLDDLLEKTEASLKKFKEREEQLRAEIDDARAATTVQLKAMVERLEMKYERAQERLDELKGSSSATLEEVKRLHDGVVSDLQSMVKTIKRRIH